MKKAVSSVISFLKKKKEDLSLLKDPKVCCTEAALDQKQVERGAKFSVVRLCKRCVLVYEKASKEVNALRALIQQQNSSPEPTETAFGPPGKKHIMMRQNRSQRFDANRDQTSAGIASMYNHLMLWSSSSFDQNLGFHHPAFIWLRICEKNQDTLLIYDGEDCALINARLDLLLPVFNNKLPVCRFLGRVNLEVWILWSKIPKYSVTLDIETELTQGYLEDLFHVAFLHVPFSREERYAKLETIFQAVDNILEMGAHAIMASGDSPESEITVKEVIIETATVVTSTAAESTATIGIETAAMALGQAAAGIAISVLVDVALTAGSVTRAKLQRDKGLMSHSQFKSAVKRKLCDSGCQFIGGTTGTIVGQVLIPVPVVGAIVGGFCGSLIGVGVSKGIMKTSELIARARTLKAITDK